MKSLDFPVEKLKAAQADLLATMEADHKDIVATLNKGDKPTDDLIEKVVKVATKVASSFKAHKKSDASKKDSEAK